MRRRRRNNRNKVEREPLVDRMRRSLLPSVVAVVLPLVYGIVLYMGVNRGLEGAFVKLLAPEPLAWLKMLGLLLLVFLAAVGTDLFRRSAEERLKKNQYYFVFTVLVLMCNPQGLSDWRIPIGAMFGAGLYGLLSWVTRKREKREILFLLYFIIPLATYWLESRFVILLMLTLVGFVLVVNITYKELLSAVLGLALSVMGIASLDFWMNGNVTVIEMGVLQLNDFREMSVVTPDDQYFMFLVILWIAASFGLNDKNRVESKLFRTQAYLYRYYYVVILLVYILFLQKNYFLYGMVLQGSVFALADYFGLVTSKGSNTLLYLFIFVLLFFLLQPFMFDTTLLLYRWNT